ncbi:hypothetical protein OTU49_002243 [Cherax quadricarinatus]|uniref:SERRATE/Ars2 N-terminal domain-containing protein n=1 Tax=Cherax quadricarinatus TaxID=27406 RepID=A0AAW0XAU9_CHEQU
MADSDDEYERRRRDKFRGERSEYTSSSSTRDRRDDSRRGAREDWADRSRDNWGSRERGSSRREYGREYGRSRDRYSPNRHDMSPPVKRMRQDWEDRRYPYESGGAAGYGAYGSAYGQDYGHPAGHAGGAGRLDELGPTQPPMMTFKAFMEQCDDSITEEEALRKYSEYKLEFKRQQLNEFFVNHKEEECCFPASTNCCRPHASLNFCSDELVKSAHGARFRG